MTNVESMTNDEARMISTLRAPRLVAAKHNSDSVFVLRHSFVIGNSSFGIRHFDPVMIVVQETAFTNRAAPTAIRNQLTNRINDSGSKRPLSRLPTNHVIPITGSDNR